MHLDDLEVLHAIATPLARPHTFTSLNQLSKRLRLSDDKVTRALARLEARLHCALIVKQNLRLVLTERGARAAQLAGQFYALANAPGDDEPEVLAIDADPVLAEAVLPPALADFLSAWGGLVTVRVHRLDADPEVLRERLAGMVAFALGRVDADPPASAEVLEPTFPWVVLLPTGHSLQDAEDGLTPDALARADRVFLPGDGRSVAALSEVLRVVPAGRRVECESSAVVRSMVAAGLGVGLHLECGQLPGNGMEDLDRVPLRGVEPERIALFLPRKADALSEAAQSLVTAIRQAVSPPARSAPRPEPAAQESANAAELVTA